MNRGQLGDTVGSSIFATEIGIVRATRDQQKVFPLTKIALEAHALGDLKCSEDAPLDLLASLPKWKESLRLRSRLGEEKNTSHL
jgi:hypothetical protein